MNNLEKYLDQVIEQRPVVYEAPAEVEPEQPSKVNVLETLRKQWYIVVLVAIAVVAVALPAIWLLVKPTYVVQGALNVAPTVPPILSRDVLIDGTGSYGEFVNTQVMYMTSTPMLQRVADDLDGRGLALLQGRPQTPVQRLLAKVRGTRPAPDAAQVLKQAVNRGQITAAHPRGTHLLVVSMEAPDPGEARQVVDSFLQKYEEYYDSEGDSEDEQSLNVLENERSLLEDRMAQKRMAIRTRAEEFGTTELDTRQEMQLQRLGVLLGEWTRLEAERINAQARVSMLEQREPNVSYEQKEIQRRQYINSDPMVVELTGTIVDMERDLLAAQQNLMEGNPMLTQREATVEAFRQRLERRREELATEFEEDWENRMAEAGQRQLADARTELQYLEAHQNALAQLLSEQDATAREVGRMNLDIQDLQFELQMDEEMHAAISRRIKGIQMEQKRPSARVAVHYPAEVRAVNDRRPQLATAAVLGALACGFGLALLREKTNKTLQTPEDIRKHLDLPIIGTTTSSRTVKPALFAEQITGDYQTIRSNLGLLNNGGMPKRLVVCSAGTREGKTTFAVNLATSVAKSGKKVLLIDGDLRKPDIGAMLDVGNGSGALQNVLLGEDSSQVVSVLSSSGLHVLTASRRHLSDPYELLSSATAAEQIDKLSRDYDHLIIDTPPALAFPDALVWAKLAEAVILVGFAGQTKAPELYEAKERFMRIKARVLGAVLSNVPVDQSLYRYGYAYRAQTAQATRKSRKSRLLLPTVDDKNGGSR